MRSFFASVFILALASVSTAVPAAFLEGRIVNGTDANDGEFPFIVSLQKSTGHSCGASIISPNWLLTAAHCSTNTDPTAYSFLYGGNDLKTSTPKFAYARRIIPHASYNPNNQYIHDIALIELSEPLDFDDYTQSVALPSAGIETAGGSAATLVGWGRNGSDGIVMTLLQKVDLLVFSDEECRQRHNNNNIHNSNVCAGVPEGGKGQCSGDSGGPLVQNGKVVGIVSWSVKPCTVYPYPGVYTEVSHYVDWIASISGVRFK